MMDSSALFATAVQVIQVYLGLGFLVGLAYALYGGSRVDESIRGSSVVFRLWILPSAAVLWPFVAVRWLRGPSREVTK